MALKYKVGDKVRIKSLDWYNENEINGIVVIDENAFNEDMSNYCGQIMTISDIELDYYLLKGTPYAWTDDMIEGLVAEENDILNEEYKKCMSDFKYWVDKYCVLPDDNTNVVNNGEISDGYHTFNELYEYRLLYNASFFNELAKQNLYDVHKSTKHSDGEDCFGGGWFIVMAELPTGQVSNHYELKDWDLFQVPEKEKANVWDGHTPQDVAKRMREFLTPKPKYPKTYEECGLITGAKDKIPLRIIGEFTRLINARNAYWKIAGEEMGLGKSWEPDYKNPDIDLYVIINIYNQVEKAKYGYGFQQCVFTFPTAEMRDAFYDNFKDLIEQCKELL